MTTGSKIEWTTHTWNPWQGCAKVSPGCANCYMFSEKRMYGQDPEKVVRSKPPTFNGPLKVTEPGMVFTCSWSDWFIREADDWRPEAWDIIRRTPHLTYQILTKRHGRIKDHLPPDWGPKGYPNVWLGVSVESEEWAERRIRALLDVPAAEHFVSAEPLLGPLNLAPWLRRAWGCARCGAEPNGLDVEVCEACGDRSKEWRNRPALSWVIVGGESGHNPRAFDVAWARTIVAQCKAAQVPVFVKQLGARPVEAGAPVQIRSRKGGDLEDLPPDLRVREFPRRELRDAEKTLPLFQR